ncbi:hypothetical protein LTR78_001590 [Recurvomyces mirabilis]|uniref:Purine permease n=1 Tax=Recurvomyces mirabilis TaxID=574656 RepID=A0AAE0WVB7_9PEZI|nr:hypothetical protein LTR78_001590 [Recurvomyces mirabilis]KAK5151838.1 hypothetical protein LTS14_008972 [Recurvomyces mirabilis]
MLQPDGFKDDGPDRIGPSVDRKQKLTSSGRGLLKALTTRDGLIGDYDYAFLFKPNLPFLKREKRAAPFFGLNQKMPVFLAMLLGFQHALSVLAGVITPPIILAGVGNLDANIQSYLVSSSLIVCGIPAAVQITRFQIWKTPYYVGTGLISVVRTSFAVIPVATGAFAQMYATGYCPSDANGNKLPCPKRYGALIGTAAICALIEVAMSFTPPRILCKIFPPLVTGPTVLLIGVSLISSGFADWAGGSGSCMGRPESGIFAICPTIYAPHPLPWGSASSPSRLYSSCCLWILRSLWYRCGAGSEVHTFKLSLYGPIVLPLLAVYVVLAMEAIGDITATCDVSRLQVDGPLFDSRIQGGVLADGLNGIVAGLCTITPMSTFAQNNGVIALTRCANRKAGYACCFWLLVMGILAKFAAGLVAIPSSVLGGMTTFLFSAVATSGIRIISTIPFTRRNRFILTAALAVGFGATLVPTWFSYVFTYAGNNKGLLGFFNAIELVLETGFAVTAFLALILNLILLEEIEDEEIPESTANRADDADDAEEWNRMHGRGEADKAVEDDAKRV